jgi:hypothetical protein
MNSSTLQPKWAQTGGWAGVRYILVTATEYDGIQYELVHFPRLWQNLSNLGHIWFPRAKVGPKSGLRLVRPDKSGTSRGQPWLQLQSLASDSSDLLVFKRKPNFNFKKVQVERVGGQTL